ERRAIRDVALAHVDGEPREIAPVASRAHEGAHGPAGREQLAHDGRAEETVGAGHERRRHACPPRAARRCARNASHAGNTTSEAAMLATSPIASSVPMLAVPTCAENASVPKLAIVVSPLASTASIVLVSNSGAVLVSLCRRCTTWMPLSTPMPTSSGSAMMFA